MNIQTRTKRLFIVQSEWRALLCFLGIPASNKIVGLGAGSELDDEVVIGGDVPGEWFSKG